jgi:hypothetical protein
MAYFRETYIKCIHVKILSLSKNNHISQSNIQDRNIPFQLNNGHVAFCNKTQFYTHLKSMNKTYDNNILHTHEGKQ